jgi:hypothetical protein
MTEAPSRSDCKAVPVAAGYLEDGFQAALYAQGSGYEAAKAHHRALLVGDVGSVYFGLQDLDVFFYFMSIRALYRPELTGYGKFSGFQC